MLHPHLITGPWSLPPCATRRTTHVWMELYPFHQHIDTEYHAFFALSWTATVFGPVIGVLTILAAVFSIIPPLLSSIPSITVTSPLVTQQSSMYWSAACVHDGVRAYLCDGGTFLVRADLQPCVGFDSWCCGDARTARVRPIVGNSCPHSMSVSDSALSLARYSSSSCCGPIGKRRKEPTLHHPPHHDRHTHSMPNS